MQGHRGRKRRLACGNMLRSSGTILQGVVFLPSPSLCHSDLLFWVDNIQSVGDETGIGEAKRQILDGASQALMDGRGRNGKGRMPSSQVLVEPLSRHGIVADQDREEVLLPATQSRGCCRRLLKTPGGLDGPVEGKEKSRQPAQSPLTSWLAGLVQMCRRVLGKVLASVEEGATSG